MSKMDTALRELTLLEEQAEEKKFINKVHPISKLALTVLYILLVVSFDKYDLAGLLGMVLYPLIVFILFDISFVKCVRRTAVILPLLLFVGIWNPFFDRTPLLLWGMFPVSGGVLSFVTLLIKGIFTILAGYLLIVTTSIGKLCAALRMLHVPQVLVTTVLFIYRYISVLLKEADSMTKAYALRAPGQKGIHFKVWGSLAGLLLLRSMDRAGEVYESMCLRGFDAGRGRGAFFAGVNAGRFAGKDFLWLLVFGGGLIVLRIYPIFEMAGRIMIK